MVFNRSKLVEFSMVSVPANPGAHTLSAIKALQVTDVEWLRELRRQETVAGLKSIADYVAADDDLAKVLADVFCFEPLEDLTVPLGDGTVRAVTEWDPETSAKAFPNEHACRIRDPGDFQQDSFRRITRETDSGKEFAIIIGRLEGEETTTAQSFRYPIADWTEAEAKERCESADGILFEPAEPEDEEPETEGEHDEDEDDDEDKEALERLARLVAEEVARQLVPVRSQLNTVMQTLGDIRELLEEQANQLPPPDTEEPVAEADQRSADELAMAVS